MDLTPTPELRQHVFERILSGKEDGIILRDGSETKVRFDQVQISFKNSAPVVSLLYKGEALFTLRNVYTFNADTDTLNIVGIEGTVGLECAT